ncbi:FYVE, RhoGEF and PH domain-containing protein 6-like isoform X1 [Denticeps clupeoides]|uniref:FYVE, RhoGEF and PH domain-containing protein 6-like n=2 Tax=Denticeps clupeoides TaxID=299321 RepID=A0AAY4BR12_9TELE|nr:FYVE, RhoGEF and PH domain-containing protein 6-like isoform X1 [Denticeps clupeoides]
MSSGAQKPPLAPKPKVLPGDNRTIRPPIPPSPGVASPPANRRSKPAVAPKPRLARDPGAASQSTVATVGQMNLRNGQEKPGWDYIIPICLCSHEDCPQCRPQHTESVSEPQEKQLHTTKYKQKRPANRSKRTLDQDSGKATVNYCSGEDHDLQVRSYKDMNVANFASPPVQPVHTSSQSQKRPPAPVPRKPSKMPVQLDRTWMGPVEGPESTFIRQQTDLLSVDGREEETRTSPEAPPQKPQRRSLLAAPPQSSEVVDQHMSGDRKSSLKKSPEVDGKVSAQNSVSRAKTFTSVDLIKQTSFQNRRIPGRKQSERTVEESVDGDLGALSGHGPTFFSVGVEQSVDGDGAEGTYENVALYEDVPEYMNIHIPAPYSAQTGHQQTSSWQSLYEPYELYEPQELVHVPRTDGQQHGPWRRDGGREEDAGEDISFSSDEDEDRSSSSSRGEYELPDNVQPAGGAKKSKSVHIAGEIMSSERVFVDVLKLLNVDFRDAVKKASEKAGKAVIEEQTLSQILYYLPQLYELNLDLLKELERRVAHWDQHRRLADIFVKKGPYLKMYSTYIREFDRNVALLDEQCRKNPAFAAAVKEFENSPRCASLAVKHYLLKPVQRIPQYQLLLTDYLKNLTEDSSDYRDTEAALGIVKEVAHHANDIMKQGDILKKLMQVQCRLNGHHEIVQPGRVFLKEGTLMKLSRKVMQPRMFFLFNDTLLYTTPVQSGQFKLNNMLSLAGMKVTRPPQEGYQNELHIESVERSFILSASSAAERDEWLEAISAAISEHTKRKISFIPSKTQEEGENADADELLGSKAPIWIPDVRATMCMICTCEFTLTWRRHHCRACGKVVCQTCSSNKHQMEYLKNRAVRVCDQCFLILQQRGAKRGQCAVDHACGASSPVGKSPSNHAFSIRKQKRIPAALKEVSANTDNSSMSGYLERSKAYKKQWKRFWFVIKDKVLYSYAASENVAALESLPLLGYSLTEDKPGTLQFKLYHKNTLYYVFKAADAYIYRRWIGAFQEAMVL